MPSSEAKFTFVEKGKEEVVYNELPVFLVSSYRKELYEIIVHESKYKLISVTSGYEQSLAPMRTIDEMVRYCKEEYGLKVVDIEVTMKER